MRLSLQQKLENAHDDGIWAAHWSPTENILATGSVDESVKLWTETGEGLEQKHQLLGLELGVVSVAIDGAGQFGAASGLDSTINVWSQTDYSAAARFKLAPAEAWNIAWLPSTVQKLGLAVAGGASNTVSLLDVSAQLEGDASAKPTVLQLPDPTQPPAAGNSLFVLSVACSADGRWIAAGTMDGTIALFDAQTCKFVARLAGHHKAVRSLAFTPDSRHLLSACDDMLCHMYDVEQAALVEALSGHESWVLSVAVHPDGSAAVTGSSDAKLRLWDLNTRTSSQTIVEHSDQIWSVAFRSDGSKVASVSDDHSICVFDFQ